MSKLDFAQYFVGAKLVNSIDLCWLTHMIMKLYRLFSVELIQIICIFFLILILLFTTHFSS